MGEKKSVLDLKEREVGGVVDVSMCFCQQRYERNKTNNELIQIQLFTM